MLSHRDDILQQALSMSPEDRAFVAAALHDSLLDLDEISPLDEGDPSGSGILIGEDFARELDRRMEAYLNGTMQAFSAEEVLNEMRRLQREEASK